MLCSCDPVEARATLDGRRQGRLASLRRILREGWEGLGPTGQLEAARTLGATHAVLEAQEGEAPLMPAEPLFQNDRWYLVQVDPAP